MGRPMYIHERLVSVNARARGTSMNRLTHVALAAFAAACIAGAVHAQKGPARADGQKPLTLASQGSFFVGGETKKIDGPPGAPEGEITVNQMYVQYQIPPRGNRHVPVVMVHGCCLSS